MYVHTQNIGIYFIESMKKNDYAISGIMLSWNIKKSLSALT